MALYTALLVACGGGGDPPAPVVPARAGAADIGAAGGTVDAVLEGGTTVSLTIPAGALASTTNFRIDPVAAPSGSLGGFRLSPNQLALSKPITLRITLPAGAKLDPAISLLVDAGARQLPLGPLADTATRSITVQLDRLDLPLAPGDVAAAAAAGRAHALASGPTTPVSALFLQNIGRFGRINILRAVVDDLMAQGTNDNAQNVNFVMEAVLGDPGSPADAVVHQAASDWRGVVCPQQQFAVNALNNFASVDIPGFARVASDALDWGARAVEVNTLSPLLTPHEPGCAGLPADLTKPVRAAVPGFLTRVQTDLDRLDPTVDAEFDLLFKTRFGELKELAKKLGHAGMVDEQGQVDALLRRQLDNARVTAYLQCRNRNGQTLQAKMLSNLLALGSVADFIQSDLWADVEQCGMLVNWRLLDAQGNVLQQGLAGGLAAGNARTQVTLPVVGDEKLVLTGPLTALQCPAGSANNEQLDFSAGPFGAALTSVGLITPSNANQYLANSSLELPVASLPQGSDHLRIQRQGGLCNGEFDGLTAHSTLVDFTFNFSVVRVDTASLPNVIEGQPYSVTLAASGGKAPYTWAVTGLPAGLSADPATGVISGTPTVAGSVSVSVTVTTSLGTTAQAALRLWVIPNLAGNYSGRRTSDEVCSDGRTNHTSSTFNAGQIPQLANRILYQTLGPMWVWEITPAGGLASVGAWLPEFPPLNGYRIDPALTAARAAQESSRTASMAGKHLTFTLILAPTFDSCVETYVEDVSPRP